MKTIEEYIKEFLKKTGIDTLPKEQQRISLIHIVAQIPWGEARTVEEVVTRNKGTCTGKHKVLQAAFDLLGFAYKPVVCTFQWGEQGIKFPQHLQSILNEGEWEHGHNFVQIPKSDGTFIDVDITWNSELQPYGFKTLPADWNGESSFVGLHSIVKRWDNADIDNMKQELITGLSPELKERRERFLHDFIQWIDDINNKRLWQKIVNKEKYY